MRPSSETHITTLLQRYPVIACCGDEIKRAAEKLCVCFRAGGKLMICGNGGSAADCVHIVGELMKGFILPRKLDAKLQRQIRRVCPDSADYLIDNLQGALPAISLVTEIGLSTAYANDQASDLAFAQQVLGHGKPGDILLAISTSGNSANVIYAAQIAKAREIDVISLTGKSGGELGNWSDILIAPPETETFKIQELHLPIYHALCLAIEQELFSIT